MNLTKLPDETDVERYEATSGVFRALLKEVRELSRKKPEATLRSAKVNVINRVLNDLLLFLKDEPAGKYLEALDSESLPQVSDALLAMVQFETSLKGFANQYHRHIDGSWHWITQEWVAQCNKSEKARLERM